VLLGAGVPLSPTGTPRLPLRLESQRTFPDGAGGAGVRGPAGVTTAATGRESRRRVGRHAVGGPMYLVRLAPFT
jgi:hypothetical protein